MFCKNCGKEVESGEYCLDCQPKQTVVEENPDTSVGRGGAVVSTVLGGIACFFASFAFGYILGGVKLLGDYGYAYLAKIASLIVAPSITCLVIALVLGIISLVKGISSIKKFKRAPKGAKPVGTLVLGIIGTVLSATTLLLVLLSVIMLIPFIA